MPRKSPDALRLSWPLLAAFLAVACTSVLDLDKLKSTRKDAALKDTPGSSENQPPPPDLSPDTTPPVCKLDEPCTSALKGPCAAGTWTSCSPATCQPNVLPGTEVCDGVDNDCDGAPDASDPQAHAACGAGKYCNGSACVAGCWGTNTNCANGNTCDGATHKCVCGSNPACSSPLACSSGSCLCGGKFACGPGETCQAGPKCVCGSTSSTTGPACQGATCTSNYCGGPPPDLGPDKKPPTPDLPVSPDQPPITPDQAVSAE